MFVLPIINHLIQQNKETQAALAGYNGIVVTLIAGGVQLHGELDENGFFKETDRVADTEIVFYASAVQKIMQGQTPGVGDLNINGDQSLGMHLLPLFGSLRYHANDDIERLLGSAAAGSIHTRATQVKETIKNVGQSLMGQVTDYAREPESPIVTQAEFNELSEEVNKLRDDVARLCARLENFEQDL